ncbi:MAG: hypothetical protein DRH06_00230 [Deltaproteobacteria bacterium]|nr:MAG: hypothetical protein DRH06_00230 [Deltaproteobacteria bacterium]
MIVTSKKRSEVTVTNSMGIVAAVFSFDEWESVKGLFLGLSPEELLDTQHLVKYPPKKHAL